MFQNPADGFCADRAHGSSGSAKRRRDRRLHSWWRHEAQSVRAAVATVLHHSCDVGRESHYVPRHQKMATAREEVVNEPHDALRGLTTPPPRERPGILPEPVPQRSDRTVRRFAGAALPTPGLPVLAGALGEAVDPSSLSFLVRRAVEDRKREEEEKERKNKEAQEKADLELAKRDPWWAQHLADKKAASSSSKRKRKKRRKKCLPRTSSFSCSSRARRVRGDPGCLFSVLCDAPRLCSSCSSAF